MSITALTILVLVGCGLSSTAFDLQQKILSRHLEAIPMVFWLALASIPLFGVVVYIDGWPTVAPGYVLPAIASVVLNILGHVTFILSVKLSPLSTTVPLLSLTPVFTAVLGLLVLGEVPSPLAVAGIVLVVVGAFWLNFAGNEISSQAPRWSHRGAGLMILTALLFSMAIPMDKLAIVSSSAVFHGFILTAGIAVGSLTVLLIQRRPMRILDFRRSWGAFTLAVVFCTLTLGLQLIAMGLTLVSVVETVKRGIGNVAAVVAGSLVFGEVMTLAKLGAACLMTLGVTLILI